MTTAHVSPKELHMSEVAKHWIDGEWVGSGTVSESINPATGAVLGRWAEPFRVRP